MYLQAILAVALAACGEQSQERPLHVLAASSLRESLEVVGQGWTASGQGPVTFSFEASSRLARQIEAGVPADAYFAADDAWMDYLEARKLVVSTTRSAWLGNTLVAVVPRNSTHHVTGPANLTAPTILHLALAGEDVPAGRYARAALAHQGAGISRLVSGDNVRSVLRWVANGEAEAGVVYGTDARVEPAVKVAFTFPAESHPPITYPAAVLSGASHPEAASAFLDWCKGPEATMTFAAAGFILTPATPGE